MVSQVPYEIVVSAFRWYHNIGDALHHFAHYGSFLSETQRQEAIKILGSMQMIPMEFVKEINELKYYVDHAPIIPNKARIIKRKIMNLQDFKEYVRETITDHPDLTMEILEFYWLAITEIEEGGSEWNEINHAINSIGELIEDATEPQVGWDVAKNHPHDISGILNHEDYWYKKEHGVYYPQLRKQ